MCVTPFLHLQGSFRVRSAAALYSDADDDFSPWLHKMTTLILRPYFSTDEISLAILVGRNYSLEFQAFPAGGNRETSVELQDVLNCRKLREVSVTGYN